MGSLDGKVAVVTGAAHGLGRLHALGLAAEGAAVVVNDLGVAADGSGRDDSAAQAVVDEIKAAGGEAVAHSGDVADFAPIPDGEYLVRVGTENRQHVMGHISLLGYNGGLIGPMTTGGPDESALGDPDGVLLTEWAAQCKKQGGVVTQGLTVSDPPEVPATSKAP